MPHSPPELSNQSSDSSKTGVSSKVINVLLNKLVLVACITLEEPSLGQGRCLWPPAHGSYRALLLEVPKGCVGPGNLALVAKGRNSCGIGRVAVSQLGLRKLSLIIFPTVTLRPWCFHLDNDALLPFSCCWLVIRAIKDLPYFI